MEREQDTMEPQDESEDSAQMHANETPRPAGADDPSLFEHVLDGVAHCRMVYDGSVPVDFVYLEVNPAFGRLTGLSGVVGKRATQVIPGIAESNPELFEIYGRVARSGAPERFETYVEPLGAWFSVSAYRPSPGDFVAVFENITERKRTVEELRSSRLAAMNLMEDAIVSRDQAREAAAELKKEIEEREQAERARRETEERYRTLFLGSWDALMILNPRTGSFTAANEATLKLFDVADERDFSALSPWVLSPELQPDGRRSGDKAKEMIAVAMRDGFNLFDWTHKRSDGKEFSAEVLLSRVEIGGEPMLQATVRDVSSRQREREELLRSEQRFQDVVNASADWVWELDENGRYTYASPNVEAILGFTVEEILGRTPFDLVLPKEAENAQRAFSRIASRREPIRGHEKAHVHKDGSIRHLHVTGIPIVDSLGIFHGYRGIDRDFTEQNLADEQRKVTVELLSICNRTVTSHELMENLVHYFRRTADCEAVGVRLKDGDDYPYYTTLGFDDKFVLLENSLCTRDPKGDVLRDTGGKPVLDCMCGNVLCGRVDPSKSFFTDRGSFWSAETTRLLATTTEADRQARTRNRCNSEGYESVALVPLRLQGNTYGLFQFNDRRSGVFTAVRVGFLENLVDYVAIALAKLKTDEALRESSEFNRQIVNSAGEGVIVCGKDMRYQVWNPYMEELSGLSAAEVLGRHPLEVYPHLKDVGVYQQLERAMEGESPDPVILRRTPPFATRTVWTSNAASALRNTKGEITGVISTVRDVTKEKEGEEALRKLSQAIEQSPAVVVITDTEGRIEFANPKFSQLTGYSLREAIGRNPRILRGDTRPELFDALWKTIKSGKSWVGEFHNRKKDGTLYWERATISPIKNEDGVTTHYLALKEDISDRKLLEAQLQQAQRIEAVGRLAGGIAHDFNNMLTVILNYAELTLYDLDPQDPAYANIQEIRKAAERSADLTRQLLAFSRKQIIEPQNVKLNALIASEQKILGRLIGEDVSVEYLPGEKLWDVFIDPSQVDQILTNLAVNARDAIAGVGAIAIETRNVTVSAAEAQQLFLSAGDYVLLSFSDTGCGMDETTTEKIFEPFFTTKEVGKGTGLGLATVYGIVKQNHGAIHVESSPGRGTTFRIYFPRFVDRRGTPRIAAQGKIPTGTETVLVAEDERRILELARTVLETCGYKVLTAGTPEEALTLGREYGGEIELLVTDVVMPLMNGRELQSHIKGLRPGIRTLFMSGYTADAIAPYGVLEEGFNFIHKPFTVASLADKVRRVLDGERDD